MQRTTLNCQIQRHSITTDLAIMLEPLRESMQRGTAGILALVIRNGDYIYSIHGVFGIGILCRPNREPGGCDVHCVVTPPPEEGGQQSGEPEAMFQEAESADDRGNHQLAQDLYRAIISDYPEHILASASVFGLFWATKEAQESMLPLASELEALRDDPNAPQTLVLSARNVAIQCKIADEAYQDALVDYGEIIANPLSSSDSIHAVIDSQLTAALASGNSILGLDRCAAARARAFRLKGWHELAINLHRQYVELSNGEPPMAESLMPLPERFELAPAFPNPFNPITEIKVALPQDAEVKFEVFNMLGQKVATLVNRPMQAGFHSVRFEASRLPSGIYIYRIKANNFTDAKKMLLLR